MYKHIIAVCIIILGLYATTPALKAQDNGWLNRANEGGLNAIGSQAYNQTNGPSQNIYQIVANIIKVVLGLLGVIFVILIILGGFKYMTAGGNDEQVKKGVTQIRNAVIGLLIVISAYSITIFITNRVVPKITNNS